MKKRIFILAGEHSGDFFGALLARDLRKLDPELDIFGIGSERMKQEGVNLLYDSSLWSAIGVIDAAKYVPKLLGVFADLKGYLRKESFSLLVLIDFPTFNMRVAKFAKEIGLKTVYYFPPSAWTPKIDRAVTVSSTVDRVITTFPYTKEIYEKAGLDAVFLGHPIVGSLIPRYSKEEGKQKFNLSSDKPLISIFPGSRLQEIKDILPLLINSAKLIKKELPHFEFALSCVSRAMRDRIEGIMRKLDFQVPLIEGNSCDLINISHFVLATCGTITLEIACLGVPMVIVYKVSPISWYIAINTLSLPDYAGLPNLILQREIVPELIHYNVSPHKVAKVSLDILLNEERYNKMKEDLQEVVKKLGEPDSAEKIAREVYSMIK